MEDITEKTEQIGITQAINDQKEAGEDWTVVQGKKANKKIKLSSAKDKWGFSNEGDFPLPPVSSPGGAWVATHLSTIQQAIRVGEVVTDGKTTNNFVGVPKSVRQALVSTNADKYISVKLESVPYQKAHLAAAVLMAKIACPAIGMRIISSRDNKMTRYFHCGSRGGRNQEYRFQTCTVVLFYDKHAIQSMDFIPLGLTFFGNDTPMDRAIVSIDPSQLGIRPNGPLLGYLPLAPNTQYHAIISTLQAAIADGLIANGRCPFSFQVTIRRRTHKASPHSQHHQIQSKPMYTVYGAGLYDKELIDFVKTILGKNIEFNGRPLPYFDKSGKAHVFNELVAESYVSDAENDKFKQVFASVLNGHDFSNGNAEYIPQYCLNVRELNQRLAKANLPLVKNIVVTRGCTSAGGCFFYYTFHTIADRDLVLSHGNLFTLFFGSPAEGGIYMEHAPTGTFKIEKAYTGVSFENSDHASVASTLAGEAEVQEVSQELEKFFHNDPAAIAHSQNCLQELKNSYAEVVKGPQKMEETQHMETDSQSEIKDPFPEEQQFLLSGRHLNAIIRYLPAAARAEFNDLQPSTVPDQTATSMNSNSDDI